MENLKRSFLIVSLRETISDVMAALRNLTISGSEEFETLSHTNKSNQIGVKPRKGLSNEHGKYVVLDQFPVPQWLAVNSSLAQEIARELTANPKVFAFRRPSKSSVKIHGLFGLWDFLIIRLNLSSWRILRKEYARILKYLDTNSKLIDYKIGDVPLGLDIYESILRLGRGTVSLSDQQTYRVIYLALKQYYFFEPLFASKRIVAVLVSHDNYIGPGLLAHMAFSFKTPVILANSVSLSMPTAPFQLYEKLRRFGIYAREIPPSELSAGMSWAESELKERIVGKIGVGMDYQLKSAFTTDRLNRQTSATDNTKVLILTHDFFDNPHGYGRMLFDDFYLWLEFLSEVSTETNYEWLIKPHRDYSNLEFQIINDFVDKFPSIKLVDPETSYHQLREEGVKFALTCYGSAGHELPLLGFTVINASYNPHISYSFNIHAKSTSDYRQILLNLPNKALDLKDLKEVYQYYFIQKKFIDQDTLMGLSQQKLTRVSQGNPLGGATVEYLLENSQEIDSAVIRVLRETVSSKLVYSFENAISAEFQLKVEISESNQEFYERLGL